MLEKIFKHYALEFIDLFSKDDYFTYWKRPKNANDVNYLPAICSLTGVGIVIQGQLILKDHFTLQTVMLYHKLYPNCPIIVSTWKGEYQEEIDKISKIDNVYIVTSNYPSVSGHGHINFQKISSQKGIELASKLQCKYVLKSRSDQRIYAGNAIPFLSQLIENYPLKIKCKAKGRIAVCNLSTLRDRLYNICDMLLFGYTDDMLRYFSPEEAPEYPRDAVLPDESDPVAFAKVRPGEIYFATKYIESCGFELKWTFSDSDYYRYNLFIVFDSESVDQFWPKYGRKEYMWRSYNSKPHIVETFSNWFVHQKNIGDIKNEDKNCYNIR